MKGKSILSGAMRYGLPLLISVGLCYVLFSQVDFRSNIALAGKYCNWWWFAAVWVVSIFSHVFRAMRWRIQLRALDINVPLHNLIYSIFGTYAVNLVFPRLGEVWRTGYVANLRHVSFTKVFGSMVCDRLADTLTVAIIILFTLAIASGTLIGFIDSEPGRMERITDILSSPWLWTAVGVVVIGVWLLASRMPREGIFGRVRTMWHSLWEGFAVVFSMRGRAWWLLFTALIWGCYFFQLYLAFYAFGFTSDILHTHGVEAVLVVFVLTTIGMMIPSNGGIGPWQMAAVWGLSIYASGVVVPGGTTFEEMSIVFANTVMTSQTLLLILLGLFTFAMIAIEKRRTPTSSQTPQAE